MQPEEKYENPEQQIIYMLDLTKHYHNLLMTEEKNVKKEQKYYWDNNVAVMETAGIHL